MNNDFNNAFNALTSLGSGDGFSNDPALSSPVGDFTTQDNLHHSGVVDFNQHPQVEFSLSAGFDGAGIFDNNQPDYSLPDSTNLHHPQPDYHQPDYHQNAGYGDSSLHSDRGYDLGSIGHHEHHSFNVTSQLQVMNCHDNCPYTTINDNGWIYKHTSEGSSGDWVGKVDGRSVYNTSRDYLGYAGTDGKVYDNHDHCVGWVHGCHVYNKGGVEVYETTRGVVGAAAYLLCVYYGGVN